jgi:TonB family protein
MSDQPAPGAQTPRTAKPPPVKHSGNNGWKWLLGAVVAVLLIGGGYYAWKNSGASNESSETAVNSATFAAPVTEDATGNGATGEENAAAAAPTDSGSADAQSVAPAKSKKAVAAVPEETIGVSRATAPTGKNDEIVVTARRPVWKYVPRPDRLADYYPEDALERGREGEASLHCMIGKGGKLDCKSVSETPARAGFGAAALRVARALRHAETRADGRSAIGTPINLRVLFRMPEGERRG